ncbi:MAG: hypothetical protein E6Q89_02590 [Bacteroidia bacterium]|nr:MAG: hypothetical protein E6Q89_02590 [Bacteroidia bacterium]
MKTKNKIWLVLGAVFLSSLLYGQGAKKPKIIVVPSKALMNKLGLLSKTDDMGESAYLLNYEDAFLNTELKGVISKFGEMMQERGFETLMLEQELEKIKKRKGAQVNYDIKVDLNYDFRRDGPAKILYVEFSGIDVYSSKQIAAASGESGRAIGATPIALLQEAVLDKIDQFNKQLMDTFEKMRIKGRESRLTIISETLSLEENINGTSVNDFIDGWLAANCVGKNFSSDNVASDILEVSQAMMPLFNENGIALDAGNFYKDLFNKLNTLVESKGYQCIKTNTKLGEIEIKIQPK